MKQLLFFFALVTIAGSMTKRPVIQPCSKEMKFKYFYKEKLIHVTYGTSWNINKITGEYRLNNLGKVTKIYPDSISVSIK